MRIVDLAITANLASLGLSAPALDLNCARTG